MRFTQRIGIWVLLISILGGLFPLQVMGSSVTAKQTEMLEVKQTALSSAKFKRKYWITLQKALGWVENNYTMSDWQTMGIIKNKGVVPEGYLENLENQVKAANGEFSRVTDYERIIMGMSAAGGNPENVDGINLIEKLYNNPNMTAQGSSGVIFGLIALDSKKYVVPADALWTREKLVDWLLENQKEAGSWYGNVDLTAMALIALAPYGGEEVELAKQKAFDWLSAEQMETGGFGYFGSETSESAAQVIIALSSNGIDPTSAAFTKSGGNVVDNLSTYQESDGGFAHIKDSGSNAMSSEQALLAFTAYKHFVKKQERIYDFTCVPAS
ncbi:terpene cyclase/mutase family protein [Hazenella sp. IB182357]|uniref:Terpene cyclase/mutase family protein n=1 Tax=Polycladospora coralii TaxID=2771432 RepID=A0A926N556_9BACL|nr:prenyltransferase/squalene oxidase repeat-containing protein [Polycladospora coralii]MBD1371464.1 terpene cyclase/mutase family protein [Polycladospora coralii]